MKASDKVLPIATYSACMASMSFGLTRKIDHSSHVQGSACKNDSQSGEATLWRAQNHLPMSCTAHMQIWTSLGMSYFYHAIWDSEGDLIRVDLRSGDYSYTCRSVHSPALA